MTVAPRHVVIAGASGVIGAGAVEHFSRLPGWSVTALSRRPPIVAPDCRFDHRSIDLRDRTATKAAVHTLPPVTHLIYAAVMEAPGLVGGWHDPELMQVNAAMFANLLDPLASRDRLTHVTVLQGTKAYGAHRHEVTVPAREAAARDDHPNFYWLQEDHARAASAVNGFGLTIFRPQVLLGHAPGAAMNPVAAIGAYAAICGERGLVFACPATVPAVWEMVDTGLLAHAFEWAAAAPPAQGQIFNITNGDVLVLRHAWPRLAALLNLPCDGTPPETLAALFAEPDSEAAWQRLRTRHDLRPGSLAALVGQSDAYLDLLCQARLTTKPVPVLLSTIKLRRSGFVDCRDSEASLVHWLQRMAELKLLPPISR